MALDQNVLGEFSAGPSKQGREQAVRNTSQFVGSHLTPASRQDAQANARAALAKEIHSARRARDEFFPSEIFADPAWDILLILYWAQHAQQRFSVSSVCAASAVPATTALRWIETLRVGELVIKSRHPIDGRIYWIGLTESATAKLDHYLAKLLDNGASLSRVTTYAPPYGRA